MHLKFSYFLLHTLIYRFSERKHVFIHKTVHVLGLVMHQARYLWISDGKYSSLIVYYNSHKIKYGENKHSRTSSNISK